MSDSEPPGGFSLRAGFGYVTAYAVAFAMVSYGFRSLAKGGETPAVVGGYLAVVTTAALVSHALTGRHGSALFWLLTALFVFLLSVAVF